MKEKESNAKQVNILVDNDLKKKIEKLKKHYGLNRTSLFRFLINKEYNEKGFENENSENDN